jgi:hypothetical protein
MALPEKSLEKFKSSANYASSTDRSDFSKAADTAVTTASALYANVTTAEGTP